MPDMQQEYGRARAALVAIRASTFPALEVRALGETIYQSMMGDSAESMSTMTSATRQVESLLRLP